MTMQNRQLLKKVGRGKAKNQDFTERRQACLHALLNRPWISKEQDTELYYEAKDHYEELRTWLLERTGMALILTRSIIKLDKAPVKAYPWMGFSEFRETQDYIFFTYSLWYLENKTELDQFLLSDVIEQVAEQIMVAQMNLKVDWTIYSQRKSMARSLRKLVELGVLIVVDGDEESWARDGRKNVLYECSPNARYVLRRFPKDLTTYRNPQELSDPIDYTERTDGQILRTRHRVFRRLLMEPSVMDREWAGEEERNYVLWQRQALMNQVEQATGWHARRYREGLVFFHPQLTSEADLFPTQAGISDLAILLGTELRRQVYEPGSRLTPEWDGRLRVSKSELETSMYRLQNRHKEFWSKEMRESSSQELARDIMQHLEDWGLAEWEDESSILLSPILGRWVAEYGWNERD